MKRIFLSENRENPKYFIFNKTKNLFYFATFLFYHTFVKTCFCTVKTIKLTKFFYEKC